MAKKPSTCTQVYHTGMGKWGSKKWRLLVALPWALGLFDTSRAGSKREFSWTLQHPTTIASNLCSLPTLANRSRIGWGIHFFRSVVYFLFCNCPCYLQHFEAGSCERYLRHFRVRTCHFPWHFAAPTVHVGWYFATRVYLIRVGLGFIWGWFWAWFRVGFRGVWKLFKG